MTVRTIDEIFRDFVTDGVPASGPFNPHKPDIRDTLKALTEGSENFPDNRVIRLNNADAGTANNIVVSASVAIPAAAYQVLYILNVTQENTGPVTVSGAINRDLVTNTSQPVPASYLTPGMAVLCIDTGTELRMLSYGDVESVVEDIVARAEEAKDEAELARDQAQNAASDAVSQGNVPIYSTRNAVETLEIPAGINAIRTNGFAAVGDGGAALYKRVVTEPSHAGKVQSDDGSWFEEVKKGGTVSFWETQCVPALTEEITTTGFAQPGDGGAGTYARVDLEPSHAGKFQSADGAWWELTGDTVTPQQFGTLVGISGVDATSAFQAALDYLEYRGGGTCKPLSGFYEITGTLRVPSNVVVDARGGVTVKRMDDIDAMVLNKSDGVTGGYGANKNIQIIGGTWDGNRDEYPVPCTAIAFGHAQSVKVKGAEIINNPGNWHGVELNAVKNGKVIGCTFRYGGGNNLGGEAIQLDTALDGGPFPWFGPYDDTPCYKITIDDNIVEHWSTAVGSHSVPIDPARRHTKVRISNNDFSVTHCGISVLRWTDVTIEDNRLFGINQDLMATDFNSWGIRVAADGAGRTTAIRIRNNVVDGFKRGRNNAGNSRGIIVAGDPANLVRISRVWITGNYVVDSGRHGIGVDYSHGAHVVDNEVALHEQVGIYIYGSTACFIQGNAVDGRTLGTSADIVIAAGGADGAGGHIVQGNRATKLLCDAPQCLVESNVISGSITASSVGGKIGPNLVAGSWV